MSLVDDWVSRFGSETQTVCRSYGGLWMEWLRKQDGWHDATHEALIERQENINGKGRYIVLDLIQRYVREKRWTS
jgi:hypothetical protein